VPSKSIKTQVVVAGAGPVGTVMAYYLAKHGIDVVVLEAGPDCAQDLRASTFHPPTLEMLDTLGIARELIDKGLKAPEFHWRERTSGEVYSFDLCEIDDATRFPFRIQCEQYHLSRMLTEKLEAEPKASVLFNHRLLSFAQTDNAVTAFAENPLEIVQLEADFLIGADGASSVVRKWLDIEFDGFTYPERFLCLTTSEPLEDHLEGLCHVNYVSDPEEWAVLLRVPSMWRVLVPTHDDKDDDYLRSDEKCADVFGRLIDKPETRTHHRTIYRVHQRVAKTFHKGRIAIIGDAAHLNNPIGGFGMNSGIHDAFNLGPRIVSILKDGAEAAPLLAEFSRDRHRITQDFIQDQTIRNMEYISVANGEQHQLRKQAMQEILADDEKRRNYLLRQSMIESLSGAGASK
jgi:3-(3-hydroxy-phenyl)propionate hydroxylase